MADLKITTTTGTVTTFTPGDLFMVSKADGSYADMTMDDLRPQFMPKIYPTKTLVSDLLITGSELTPPELSTKVDDTGVYFISGQILSKLAAANDALIGYIAIKVDSDFF